MIGSPGGPRRAAWRTTAAATAIAATALWAAIGSPVLGGGVPPGAARPGAPGTGQVAVVRRVVDGDTIDVRIGGANRRVRLVQIDTPEVFTGAECYGAQASAATKRLLPVGAAVTLYDDPGLDRIDAYGRLLRLRLPRCDERERVPRGERVRGAVLPPR